MLPYLSSTDPALDRVREGINGSFMASKGTNDRALQIIRRNFHNSKRFATLSPPRRSFNEQLNGTQILAKKSKVSLIPKNRDFHNHKPSIPGPTVLKSQRIKLASSRANTVRIPTGFQDNFLNVGTPITLDKRLKVTRLKPLS